MNNSVISKKNSNRSQSNKIIRNISLVVILFVGLFGVILRAFADSDVVFELTPDQQVYNKEDYVTINVKFNTAKEWDKFAINLIYDTDVFDVDETNFTTAIKKYDGTNLANSIKNKLQVTPDGEGGRYTIFGAFKDGTTTYTGGLDLGTFELMVKPDAPGGNTDISFVLEMDGDPMTYVMNGDDSYTFDSPTLTVTVSVPVEEHDIEDYDGNPINSMNIDLSDSPQTIHYSYYPTDTTDTKGFTCVSDNTDIVTTSLSGDVCTVTPVAVGNANIEVKEFGTTHTIPVTVTAHLQSISLNQATVELAKNDVFNFIVTKNPSSTSDNVTYTWTSDNTNIATVDNAGRVTGVSGGTTTIHVTAVVNGTPSSIQTSATVRVVVPFTNAYADPNTINLNKGNSQTINVVYEPSDATQTKSVSWSTNNDSVATVDANGKVTAVGGGDAVITGTVSGLSPFTVNVHVDVPMTGFSITPTEVNMYVGQTKNDFTPTFTPSLSEITETNKSLSWSSSATSVATASNGEVTAVGPGTATITVIPGTHNELKKTITVHVYNEITDPVISHSSVTLYTNDTDERKTQQLSVNNIPSGANPSDSSITWSSTKTNVATVSVNGLVTAVGNGTTTIKATLGNGTVLTCDVTVETVVKSLSITNGSSVTIEKGKNVTLNTSINPSNASHKTVLWSSDDTSVATVDSTGKVTGVANGSTSIRATIDGDPASATITVYVVNFATGISINGNDTITVLKGDNTTTLSAIVSPADASPSEKIIKWSSNKTNIVSIDADSGVIQAKAGGTAIITASAGSEGHVVTDTVTVNVRVPTTNISISGDQNITLSKGNSKTLSTVLTPSDSTDSVTWSSSDSNKVSVDSNGKITANEITTSPVVITATSGGKSSSVNVTVVVPATGITINGTKPLTIQKGQSQTLATTITPNDCTDTNITWTSSDSNKVSVDSTGKVTGVAAGSATITAKVGSVQDTILVNVVVSANSVTITEGDRIVVNKDSTTTLHATINPSDSTDTIRWSSSDSSKVSVDSNGKIKALATGEYTITATAGDKSDSILVKVELHATNVVLENNLTSVTLEKGASKNLSLDVTPAGYTDTVSWSSSDSNKVSVDSTGKITALSPTSTPVTITATVGNITKTIKVNVVVSATKITLKDSNNNTLGTSMTLHRGESTTLKYTVTPTDSTDSVVWSSSKTNIATVDSTGKVTASTNNLGTTVIKVKAGNVEDTVTLTVDAPITGFTSSNTDISIIKGRNTTLTYEITPSDTTDDKTIQWTSADSDKVTVDSNGKITGKSAGTTTVTARLGSYSITYRVTVGIIPLTSISLNQNDFELRKGDSETLTYTLTEEDTTEAEDAVWSSSDTNVATVDSNGKVTGKSAGEAVITVRMASFSDTVKVTVYEVPLTSISISNTSDNVSIGDTFQINIAENPTNTTDAVTYTYESSDEDIAIVDEHGKVKGLRLGEVTITVRSSNGLEDTITLNVVNAAPTNSPNTGVRSIFLYIITGLGSLVGLGFVFKKKHNVK